MWHLLVLLLLAGDPVNAVVYEVPYSSQSACEAGTPAAIADMQTQIDAFNKSQGKTFSLGEHQCVSDEQINPTHSERI